MLDAAMIRERRYATPATIDRSRLRHTPMFTRLRRLMPDDRRARAMVDAIRQRSASALRANIAQLLFIYAMPYDRLLERRQ